MGGGRGDARRQQIRFRRSQGERSIPLRIRLATGRILLPAGSTREAPSLTKPTPRPALPSQPGSHLHLPRQNSASHPPIAPQKSSPAAAPCQEAGRRAPDSASLCAQQPRGRHPQDLQRPLSAITSLERHRRGSDAKPTVPPPPAAAAALLLLLQRPNEPQRGFVCAGGPAERPASSLWLAGWLAAACIGRVRRRHKVGTGRGRGGGKKQKCPSQLPGQPMAAPVGVWTG